MRYRVQDRDGDTDSQSFTVTVERQEQDTSPVLPSISDKTYPVGDYVSERLPVATGGNGSLIYSLTPSISGADVRRRDTDAVRHAAAGWHLPHAVPGAGPRR